MIEVYLTLYRNPNTDHLGIYSEWTGNEEFVEPSNIMWRLLDQGVNATDPNANPNPNPNPVS